MRKVIARTRAALKQQKMRGYDTAEVAVQLEELEIEDDFVALSPPDDVEYRILDLFESSCTRLLNEIEDTASAMGLHCARPIFVGTYPTETMESCLLPPDRYHKDDLLIAIDAGMMTFLNLASKALCRCIPGNKKGTPRPQSAQEAWPLLKVYISNNMDQLSQPYVDAMYWHGIMRNIMGAKRYLIHPDWKSSHAEWLEIMKRFLIAHEFAHAVIDTERELINDPESPINGLNQWSYKRNEEFKADEIATRVVIEHYRQLGFPLERSVTPVFGLFTALHHAFWMRHVGAENSLSDGTSSFARFFSEEENDCNFHPAPMVRAMAVLEVAKETKDADAGYLHGCWDAIDLINMFMSDALSDMAKQYFAD